MFYSDYKHLNTYKALIGKTPAGGLSFISELSPDSISDREIVSRSATLNPYFWSKGDEVIADKSNIPVFLEGKEQFSPQGVIVNQQISSQSIHVEILSRIKYFHIFDRPLALSMLGPANQMLELLELN